MKNKVNIGYLTALALMVTTGLVQASSMALMNSTSKTIYVQFNYKKNGHNTPEGSQTTVPVGTAGTGS